MKNELLGYFITWTCYGTHLPGDDRGWTKWHSGEKTPQPMLEDWCRKQMSESAVILNSAQRTIVQDVVTDHCQLRRWPLHVVNCRTNHCHVVVTADGYAGGQVLEQLKAWASRRLKENQRLLRNAKVREKWWTKNGSIRHLNSAISLDAAIQYTLEGQDLGGSKRERES